METFEVHFLSFSSEIQALCCTTGEGEYSQSEAQVSKPHTLLPRSPVSSLTFDGVHQSTNTLIISHTFGKGQCAHLGPFKVASTTHQQSSIAPRPKQEINKMQFLLGI
ncbi:hypothetical protein FRC19_002131 [Serendipita sp. 401]|nr:hypothetical protein FRC15_008946 [Serendipita sp. 397]KAG8797504.1 hypothetical protein FRC16_008804 [Serendipita sp. 398]KAG8813873.1 hypothetical protein FRC19_002131 [Serendipita sp. 401]KAG8830193.1 hypothetical protein FRC18_008539 [Serendipita sp. 400]KAG8866175.1 hypothetical protein FRC20_009003 [Serendipita sp. 405]KAG9023626.1 hypothetical protein FS842_005688 [Serendipita sp. 407]